MEVKYIQGINIRLVALILQRNFNGHETSTKLCMFQGRTDQEYCKENDEYPIFLAE